MVSLSPWVQGARPKTLPAAVVPVVVGTACVVGDGVIWWRAACAMIVAVALQIGTNFANDYSDGVRGTDDDRTGPLRLVASGVASPTSVKRAAQLSFGIAGLFGTAVSIAVGPELLVVGVLSVAAGWLYTGGPKPYGYYGWGEVFVFVFFGLVATIGSAYVQHREILGVAVIAAVPVGLLATALLIINNLRDIPSDAATGKNTLAVRMGDRNTRIFYTATIALSFVGVVAVGSTYRPWASIALGGLVLTPAPVRVVASGATGASLISVLGATGRLQLVTGLLLATGIALSG
ncbi:MAG: 1,4-dihydroxy-2-naphthoate polyprenyltransferase [Acidobacteria bacterium]|nr:1,4-dihydroxy-2-naphthoate polyprenyltransferase [Acidobacteriota bacterium]